MARTDPRPHYGERRPRITNGGYRIHWRPEHPLAMADGYVLEHRMVAWDADLLTDPSMHVHHLNGDKLDNRVENFELVTNEEHGRRHRKGCATHGEAEMRPVMKNGRQNGRYCAICSREKCRRRGQRIAAEKRTASVASSTTALRRAAA